MKRILLLIAALAISYWFSNRSGVDESQAQGEMQSDVKNANAGGGPEDLQITEDNFQDLLKRETPLKGTPEEKTTTESPQNPFIESVIKPLQPNIDAIVQKAFDSGEAVKLLQNASALSTVLGKCLLEESLCGQRERANGYFNPEMTPYHRDMNRTLVTLIVLGEKDASLLNQLDRNNLIQMLGIQNTEIPLKATELLIMIGLDEGLLNQVLKTSEKIKGSTKAFFLDHISGQNVVTSGSGRDSFLSEVERTLERADRHTAIAVSRQLQNYELNDKEFFRMAKALCRLKSSSIESEWPMIRRNLISQGEQLGFSTDMDKICK